MKNLLLLLLFIPSLGIAQYPIVEEFNVFTSWTYTNGAGMQNYGGTENYATFNIGTTPYPNDATVTITSPIYDLTNCASNINVQFEIGGIIEDGYDFAYFEYWNGASWVVVQTYTGLISPSIVENYVVPNTATRFRFRLETDLTVNTYTTGPPPTTNMYYYDITYFIIDCVSGCPHQICLEDTYGDGWHGDNFVTVNVNGSAVLTNLTLASGSGPDCYTFLANTGDVIDVTYIAGSWPAECNYTVTDANGTALVSNYFPSTSGVWSGNGYCGTLPVELISFIGDCYSLSWATASENNSDYFQVEMSADGINWEIIETIDAAGNSLSLIEYNLEHRSTYAIQYYRLRQVDIDGKFELFGPISMICDIHDKTIEGIYNTMGQRVGRDLTNLSSGIYFIRYTDETTRKIIL